MNDLIKGKTGTEYPAYETIQILFVKSCASLRFTDTSPHWSQKGRTGLNTAPTDRALGVTKRATDARVRRLTFVHTVK